MPLSNEALRLVVAVFSSKDLNFPASVAAQVVEVRAWAEAELPPALSIAPPADAP